jgi:hypothetical protein
LPPAAALPDLQAARATGHPVIPVAVHEDDIACNASWKKLRPS